MSGEIQWPLVAAKLVEVLPTLGGAWDTVTIYDGPSAPLGNDPLFCSVGMTSPADGAEASCGTFTREQDADGFETRESGTVLGQITAVTGDDDYPAMRALVFDLAGRFTGWVSSHRTLDGALSSEGTSSLGVDVMSPPVTGADQTLVFALQYYTVT